MSRTLRTVALALALVPGAATAQDLPRRVALLDSIVIVQRQASARRQAWDDSAAAARRAMDTMTVGVFRLVVQPANREIAVAAARMAMDTLGPLGEDLLAMVRPHRIIVRRAPIPRWAARPIPPVVVARLDSAGVEQRPMWDYDASPRNVGNYFIEQARGLIAARVDPRFATWLGATNGIAPIRFDTVLAADWSYLRLDLVSTPTPGGRQCFDGHLGACRIVLGLDSAMGTRSASGHRIALLQLAIQLGGPGAPARAVRGTTGPAEHLAQVAGVPTDSLVRLWHARVRNARVPSDNMTSGMAMASLGWIALLVVLASRSRRWR